MPALLLRSAPIAATRATTRRCPGAALGAPLVVVAVWVAWSLAGEVGGLEASRTVDQWRAFVDALLFAARRGNLLAERYDTELSNLAALPFLFQGPPFWALGLGEPSLPSLQLHQVLWLAVAGLSLAAITASFLGPLPAAFAAASFLFSPFTHLMAVSAAPFVFGPVMTVALLLAWRSFARTASPAALAAAGPLAGLAALYPSMIPIVAAVGLHFLARLRSTWSALHGAWVAGAVGLFAAVLPAFFHVFSLAEAGHYLSFHGKAAYLDLALLGQASVLLMEEGRTMDIRRPADIAIGALLAPFAHSRLHIRIWGDTIFDPLTSLLFAFGLATSIHSLPRNPNARTMLGLFVASLVPSFVSPVDRVDVVHSVALAIPVALIAAAGLANVLDHLMPTLRLPAALVAALLSALSGHWLVHRVNPYILSASATGIALESLAPAEEERAVFLDYPAGFHPDVRWLYVGPMTAYAGRRPVGYWRWQGSTLPVQQFLRDGKDLVFWSPGLEHDLAVSRSLCAQVPGVTLFELRDPAALGRVWAANLSTARWEPRLEGGRWRLVGCGELPHSHSPAAIPRSRLNSAEIHAAPATARPPHQKLMDTESSRSRV